MSVNGETIMQWKEAHKLRGGCLECLRETSPDSEVVQIRILFLGGFLKDNSGRSCLHFLSDYYMPLKVLTLFILTTL